MPQAGDYDHLLGGGSQSVFPAVGNPASHSRPSDLDALEPPSSQPRLEAPMPEETKDLLVHIRRMLSHLLDRSGDTRFLQQELSTANSNLRALGSEVTRGNTQLVESNHRS